MVVGTYKGRREETPGRMMWRHKGNFASAWNAEQFKNKMIAAGFEAKVENYTDGYSVYVMAPHDFWKDQFIVDNTRQLPDASFAAMAPRGRNIFPPRRDEFETTKRRIARQTLNMPEEIAGVFGGTSAAEARRILYGEPPEMRRFAGDDFELLGGNPEDGFATQEEAKQLAKEWLVYPEGGHVRVVLWHERWYAYGN
jgi:hypothetical protein